jgi:SAM-dependent methyltransferase
VGRRVDEGEAERVEQTADWYLTRQLAFDRRLVALRYETLMPHIRGPRLLELGCGDGVMTELLRPHAERLTVVDGSTTLLDAISSEPPIEKVHVLFEKFEPDCSYETIVVEHVLEHVEDPVALLRSVRGWLAPGGKALIGVPNANSLHRLAAVKMGILESPTDLGDRDRDVGHRRVYTLDGLRADVEAAGLTVRDAGGVFLKPLTADQIEAHWSEEMVSGFFELGKEFPEIAAELSFVADAG